MRMGCDACQAQVVADAMQGVEVWESIGTGPEEVDGKVEVGRGCRRETTW